MSLYILTKLSIATISGTTIAVNFVVPKHKWFHPFILSKINAFTYFIQRVTVFFQGAADSGDNSM